jgi:glycosidase
LAEGWQTNNVACLRDVFSIWNLYRRLLHARRKMPALSVGSYRSVHVEGDLLVYLRQHDDSRILIALNLTDSPQVFTFEKGAGGRILVSTGGDRDGETVAEGIRLRGDEGLIVEL